MTTAFSTNPTPLQSRLIADGNKSLPFTLSKQLGTQTGCEVVHRGEDGRTFPQVINRMEMTVPMLSSLNLLLVSKQVLQERKEVLYGENTFALNTSQFFQYRYRLHEHGEFEHFPNCIPGMPRKDGTPQTPRQTQNAIERMFAPDKILPKFVARDPMLHFFHRIGRFNTSLLTKIQIEGEMKTVWDSILLADEPEPALPTYSYRIGFSRILDILTTVLKEVCPNLRELTLVMRYYESLADHQGPPGDLGDEDPFNKANKSDEERIDEVVEKLVTKLVSVRDLKLGPYAVDPAKDVWGKSARWINLVKERARKREEEEKSTREESTGGTVTRTRNTVVSCPGEFGENATFQNSQQGRPVAVRGRDGHGRGRQNRGGQGIEENGRGGRGRRRGRGRGGKTRGGQTRGGGQNRCGRGRGRGG